MVRLGQCGDRLAVTRATLFKFCQPLGIETVLTKLVDHETRAMATDLVPHRMSGQEFARRHPQLRTGFVHQPGRQTEVVRMKMGDDQAPHRGVQRRQQFLPDSAHAIAREARVDDRPSVPVTQQPEVDVIELERQRHTQPAYSLTEEKVRFAYETEVFYSMMDSAELCQFVYGPTWTLYGPNETVSMMNSVTGWDLTVEELMTVGRRRLDLFRTFNAREGLGRKDDRLPKKFFKELKGTGPTAGFALTHEEVDSAIDHYYKLAGWTNDGIPTPETLKKHDVEWAVEYLPA